MGVGVWDGVCVCVCVYERGVVVCVRWCVVVRDSVGQGPCVGKGE